MDRPNIGVALRKLAYFVAATLDGFIAAPDGSFDFFPLGPDLASYLVAEWPQTLPTFAHAQLGVASPATGRFDAVLMGRVTYELGLKLGHTSPYDHLKQYVFSRSLAPASYPDVEIVSGDPSSFVRQLKARPGRDIWLCGGGQLAGQLLDELDELVLKLNPVVAGSGIPLVDRGFDPHRFALTSTRTLASGVIVAHYTRQTGDPA
ncbi:dihydrofolate reductase family protein [Salinispora sp. H7-4]|uniref:dihydrofolate reductase family protein n=1 Tax=Salinispora sp. H7-4 TaxID=2748321 RepID=UPI0015D2FA59|nr:dihydrofolate reductase family protein [Salinispora sp. H7-4]NYT92900.1 dihydrofolate reductase family protein [Salinispora sp. H7-4]